MRSKQLPMKINLANKPGSKGRFTDQQLKCRFGLKEVEAPRQLKRHVDMFLEALRAPVDLLRDGICDAPLGKHTVGRIQKDVYKYLGFLVNIQRSPASTLSLAVFANTQAFSDYLEFLNARGVGTMEIGKQVLVGKRVNIYLKNLMRKQSKRASAASMYEKAVGQLEAVGKQVGARVKIEAGSNVK